MKYTNIFYPAGAFKGYAVLGALEYLEKTGHLEMNEHSHRISASVGTLIALFHIIFGTSFGIKELFDKYSLENILYLNVELFKDENMYDESMMGLLDGKVMRNMIMKEAKIDETMTFSDFCTHYPNANHWYIMLTSVERGETIYASVKTHGKEKIQDLIFASCCIPFLYSPVKLSDGFLYVDGGVRTNLPVYFIHNTLKLSINSTLLFQIDMRDNRKTPILSEKDFASTYIQKIFNIIVTNNTDTHYLPNIIRFSIKDNLLSDRKEEYYQTGILNAKRFIA